MTVPRRGRGVRTPSRTPDTSILRAQRAPPTHPRASSLGRAPRASRSTAKRGRATVGRVLCHASTKGSVLVRRWRAGCLETRSDRSRAATAVTASNEDATHLKRPTQIPEGPPFRGRAPAPARRLRALGRPTVPSSQRRRRGLSDALPGGLRVHERKLHARPPLRDDAGLVAKRPRSQGSIAAGGRTRRRLTRRGPRVVSPGRRLAARRSSSSCLLPGWKSAVCGDQPLARLGATVTRSAASASAAAPGVVAAPERTQLRAARPSKWHRV